MAKYSKEKQTGNKGEAFFESLISDHALVHKIDGSKDVGLDFICEWISGDKPTQLLFGIQVKTRRSIKPQLLNDSNRRNKLPVYKINLERIPKTTFQYWQGFDFPVFVFLVHITSGVLDCYYKRYTPILHEKEDEKESEFYKVNSGHEFLAFIKERSFCGGFCRDLYIDHLRCQHKNGMLSGVNPKDLGLTYWDKDKVYETINDYKDEIASTYKKYENWKKFFLE